MYNDNNKVYSDQVVLTLQSWIDRIRPTSACIDWLVFIWYGWEGNGNPTYSHGQNL